jgi:hypothetical protein
MLQIEIAKQVDGTGLLRCTRGDGSITWQKQNRHAAHFAWHDLTHYAVETALGFRHAFFGLIAAGWDVEETTGKGARGGLPDEALEAEKIVGLLDAERASGASWSLDEFNASLHRPLTDVQIQEVRSIRATLFTRWSATEAGQILKLEFGPK